jgi:hypothetical protein
MLHCKSCGKKGERNHGWKGGTTISQSGYRLVRVPGHPQAHTSGYVMEHVFVMTEHLRRFLLPEENVHHRNGIRDDNRLENLELWSTSQPFGQRVADKVEWAKEMLRFYEPGALASSSGSEPPAPPPSTSEESPPCRTSSASSSTSATRSTQ